MKLLISNQHGAIVMALMPFLYGMFCTTPIWQHIFLLLAWFSIYLLTYPFLNLFKGKNLSLYIKWSIIYASAATIFILPALWHNWKIIYFACAMLPFLLLAIYYTKQKNERALLNDFAGIAIFALAGMGAYYFPERTFDTQIGLVAFYPSLYFVGTTLYVKSVLRERKNPMYFKVSVSYHLFCVLFFLLAQQYLFVFAFVVPLLRAIIVPKQKLSTKQIGLLEMVISLYFFILLLVENLSS